MPSANPSSISSMASRNPGRSRGPFSPLIVSAQCSTTSCPWASAQRVIRSDWAGVGLALVRVRLRQACVRNQSESDRRFDSQRDFKLQDKLVL